MSKKLPSQSYYVDIMNLSDLRQLVSQLLPLYKFAVILDSCTDLSTQKLDPYSQYDFMAGFSNVILEVDNHKDLEVCNKPNTPLMGFISYDAKVLFENVPSYNKAHFNLPKAGFIKPEIWITVKNGQTEILGEIPKLNSLESEIKMSQVKLCKQVEKSQYIENVKSILQEIQKGNIYEMNYCTSFTLTAKNFNPYQTYLNLIQNNPVPFSGFVKYDTHFLICNSPERYINKKGTQLISQPIKGTAPRKKEVTEDQQSANKLTQSNKEFSENVMIVDLVRNDLSRIAERGSVKVTELAKLYSFPSVHQLISTIQCSTTQSFTNILSATFPMGSMTGAPKISAMNIIERFEDFSRGWYSGSIGYILPNGDFDFNVVIRSLMYDSENENLYYSAGGAITSLSDPEMEWEELKLKVSHIEKLLNIQSK
jgi:para-aminobenzoate synthetase component 1